MRGHAGDGAVKLWALGDSMICMGFVLSKGYPPRETRGILRAKPSNDEFSTLALAGPEHSPALL